MSVRRSEEDQPRRQDKNDPTVLRQMPEDGTGGEPVADAAADAVEKIKPHDKAQPSDYDQEHGGPHDQWRLSQLYQAVGADNVHPRVAEGGDRVENRCPQPAAPSQGGHEFHGENHRADALDDEHAF